MTRLSAFLTHLIISLLIVTAVFIVIRFQFYPDFYFSIQGISEIILILFAVDVVLGPLLTLIVFKKGKKSLKLDLSIIALCQLAALIYGSYIIYQERPLSALLLGKTFLIQTASNYDLATVDTTKVDASFWSSPDFHVFDPSIPVQIEMSLASVRGESLDPFFLRTELYSSIAQSKEKLDSAALSEDELDKHYPDLKHDTTSYHYIKITGKAGFGLVVIDKRSYEAVSLVALTDFNMNPI